MINASTELNAAFMRDSRKIETRIRIKDKVYTNDNLSSVSFEYGSLDGPNFALGASVASSVRIVFVEIIEGLKELDEIKVEMGAELPDGTIEYVKMGTFIINERVEIDRNGDTTKLSAMDKMVMMGAPYVSKLGTSARIRDIALEIANLSGVEVDGSFANLRTTNIKVPTGYSYREAIGVIAQFESGFATFNREGKLQIKRLNNTTFRITPDRYVSKGLVKNEVLFKIDGITCITGDREEDVLTVGNSSGTQITLNNNSMTQSELNRIFQDVKAINYFPFSLSWYGNPLLETGDYIEIEDLKGNRFKTPNLSYSLEFNGGLKATSRAESESSSDVVYNYTGPLQQQINYIRSKLSANGQNRIFDDVTEPTNPEIGDIWFKPNGPDIELWTYGRKEDGALGWIPRLTNEIWEELKRDIEENEERVQEAIEAAEEAEIVGAEARKAGADAAIAAEAARIAGENALRAAADAALEGANARKEADAAKVIGQNAKIAADDAKLIGEDARKEADAAKVAGSDAKKVGEEAKLAGAEALKVGQEAKLAGNDAKKAAADALTAGNNAKILADKGIADALAANQKAQNSVDSINTAVSNAGFSSLNQLTGSLSARTNQAQADATKGITDALRAFNEAKGVQTNVNTLSLTVDDVKKSVALKAEKTDINRIDGSITTIYNQLTFQAGELASKITETQLTGAIDGIHIGGRNYVLDSDILIKVSDYELIPFDAKSLEPFIGQEVTISVNIRRVDFNIQTYANFYLRGTIPIQATLSPNFEVHSGFNRYSYTFLLTDSIVNSATHLAFRSNSSVSGNGGTNKNTEFEKPKIEVGNKRTDWSPAPEDIQQQFKSVETSFTQTSKEIALKANQTTVNTLSGSVSNLSAQQTIQAGLINQKVSMTEVNNAIDGITSGGRNYIKNTSENYTTVTTSNFGYTWNGLSVFVGDSINVGDSVVLAFEVEKLPEGRLIQARIMVRNYSGGTIREIIGNYITEGLTYVKYIVQEGDHHLDPSSRKDNHGAPPVLTFKYKKLRLNKSNILEDWSPAPEDMATTVQVTSEIKQAADSITSTVSDLNGRVTTQQQTLNGLQTIVANKAEQSQVTQLANLYDISVGDRQQGNLISATSQMWESGGRTFADGAANTDSNRIRTKEFVYINPKQPLVIESSQDVAVFFYTDNGNFINSQYWFSNQTITPHGATRKIKFTMKAKSGADINPSDIFDWKINIYQPDSSLGQISVLRDNINLRVEKDNVIGQINVSSEGILIDGAKNHITGRTTIDNAVIKTAHIDNLAVNTAKIANAAITNAKIESLAVDTAKIKDAAITNAKIENLAVNTAKIANLAVDSAKIANLAVGTAQIANAAIDTAKIGDLAVDTAKIKDAAISNAKIGNLAVDTANIRDAAISNAKIGNLAVDTANIKDAAISNAKIGNLAVGTAQIINAAITNAKIENLAVTSAKIANLAVGTAQIENAAITNAKIGNLAVGTANIGNGVITNAKIGNAAIDTANIRDAAITAAKIISLDVTAATAGTIRGTNSDWNLNTGTLEFTHPTSGNTLTLTQGDITFKRGTQERRLEYTAEGLIISPGSRNSGTGLNASIQINGGGASSFKYIQFNDPGTNSLQRLQAIDNHMDLMPGAGGRVRVMTYGGGGSYASVEALMFYTNHPSGKTLRVIEDRIETPRDGNREIIISPQGDAKVRIRNAAGGYYDIVASAFLNSSSRKLKTNIVDFSRNALEEINKLKVVEYDLIRSLEDGINDKQIGLIAEDSPSVSGSNGTAINSYKVDAYLIKAVQDLDYHGKQLQSKVSSLEMYVKGNLEIELTKAKIKIEELEYKLKQMEEVA